jgi:hypothetical protein
MGFLLSLADSESPLFSLQIMLCKGICLAIDSIIVVFAPPLGRQLMNN